MPTIWDDEATDWKLPDKTNPNWHRQSGVNRRERKSKAKRDEM